MGQQGVAGMTPVQCLENLQQVHADYLQDGDRERHRARASEGIRQYANAVQVEKDLEDLL